MKIEAYCIGKKQENKTAKVSFEGKQGGNLEFPEDIFPLSEISMKITIAFI